MDAVRADDRRHEPVADDVALVEVDEVDTGHAPEDALHLVGWDDRDPVEADLMHRRERQILGDAPDRLWKGLLRD